VKLDVVAGSGVDEFYTPPYAIFPLVKYLKKGATVWCPFDSSRSWFVILLRAYGFEVLPTHLADGVDFFSCAVPDCDYIISNPPYSRKGDVLDRLFLTGKSFAMLVGVVGLFESQKRFQMFKNNDFELMYFNKRIAYFKSYDEQSPSLNPPFSSVYVCKGILPKQMVFEELDK